MCIQNQQNPWFALVVGLFGGFGVWIAQYLKEEVTKYFDKKKVYNWLSANVGTGQQDQLWRKTRTIASHTNLTHDRIEYICSIHPDIVESVERNEGLWSIKALIRPDQQG